MVCEDKHLNQAPQNAQPLLIPTAPTWSLLHQSEIAEGTYSDTDARYLCSHFGKYRC